MKIDKLNDETIKAIKEGEEMLNNPNSQNIQVLKNLEKL